MLIHLEQENYNDLIKEGLVLVDFYAQWCGPCKMLASVLEELANENYKIIKIDIDKHEELTKEYKVMSVPSIFIIKNNEIKNQIIGFTTYEDLKQELEKYE